MDVGFKFCSEYENNDEKSDEIKVLIAEVKWMTQCWNLQRQRRSILEHRCAVLSDDNARLCDQNDRLLQRIAQLEREKLQVS